MSTSAIRSEASATGARVGQVDLKLEVITIPVSDFDRSKNFYEGLRWRLARSWRGALRIRDQLRMV